MTHDLEQFAAHINLEAREAVRRNGDRRPPHDPPLCLKRIQRNQNVTTLDDEANIDGYRLQKPIAYFRPTSYLLFASRVPFLLRKTQSEGKIILATQLCFPQKHLMTVSACLVDRYRGSGAQSVQMDTFFNSRPGLFGVASVFRLKMSGRYPGGQNSGQERYH
ncbi:uncharacterized protein FOMMEDRAFT_162373 [Fomitiporia mediterranea MF3/22]|uniref:uncharacterized protein n=1 Tax=Fomitiporia mediterranea (strain MF3/22) TaxID=694068 RepID=UPI0004407973|nr:uncharacterized protein FOMMEDRAFT_162373 [Fomitiporia mediterranea MF3/22]EJC98029.1 hypothetical protein FOMMEDRAFT_162373 [Fomitiporia mediterranea MF3/22]